MGRTLGGVLLLVLGASVTLIGHAQSAQKPRLRSFEAASVKPFSDADGPGILQVSPGRLSLAGVTVAMLIQQAYTISGYRIYGGPSWLNSARFNVVAKAADVDGPLTLDEMRPMLQSLMTERFRLVVHHDTKELPLYRLVVAKGGPKFTESTASRGPQSQMGMGRINDDKAGMDTLASQLGQQLGRFVSNQTGLTGDFIFHVEWTPDPGQNKGADAGAPPSGTDGTSLFTALDEQLGLKLESAKGPVDVLVIDHVERPTPD